MLHRLSPSNNSCKSLWLLATVNLACISYCLCACQTGRMRSFHHSPLPPPPTPTPATPFAQIVGGGIVAGGELADIAERSGRRFPAQRQLDLPDVIARCDKVLRHANPEPMCREPGDDGGKLEPGDFDMAKVGGALRKVAVDLRQPRPGECCTSRGLSSSGTENLHKGARSGRQESNALRSTTMSGESGLGSRGQTTAACMRSST